ncbi:MAG: hypothetical protein QM766_02865 [Burkholderiaceae bacterium]
MFRPPASLALMPRGGPAVRTAFLRLIAVAALGLVLAGCATGPRTLSDERLVYNEVIKKTAEQQLLLNIVRLRYADTPSSLAVSSVATQYETVKSLGLLPFFGVVGNETGAVVRGSVLPTGSLAVTERPTVTFTPQDDQEFTRKLFTPMTLDGVLYLAKTTWPIASVFRLWLENLNWVSNAETASGPTSKDAPEYARFLAGIDALQALQDRGQAVFTSEERDEVVGSPFPADRLDARAMVEAARDGLAFKALPDGRGWVLTRKRVQPMLRLHPAALGTAEMAAFTRAFRLRQGVTQFDINIEQLSPFPDTYPQEGVATLDLETRSLLQVLYFVSKGVEVPEAHMSAGLVRSTLNEDGSPFDWHRVTERMFRVQVADGEAPPPTAQVAVRYLDHWFFVDKTDHDSMSTFALMMELSRLELTGNTGPGPTLTLPLSGR